jgi:outer membrane protein assembly factor BamE
MVTDRESQALRDGRLPLFDAGIHELFDAAAVQTHDVIVMRAVIELEDGHAILEVMPGDESRRLKLRQNAVDGGQADVLITVEECAIDVFGRQMARIAALENFQNLESRQRDFEAGFAEVFTFHLSSPVLSKPIIAYWNPMRSINKKLLLTLALGAACAVSSGCVYRVNIQQGNFLEARTVNQLQVGMTRSQVRYLLGTPMVPNAFDKERWDYLYFFKKGRWRKPEERHVIVYFKEDKVDKFERINVPEKAPTAPDKGAPIEKFPVI